MTPGVEFSGFTRAPGPCYKCGMARPLRIDYPGAIYHITCRGNERRAIFGDDADRLAFQKRLATCVSTCQLRVHGYVLMDNHYTWRRLEYSRVRYDESRLASHSCRLRGASLDDLVAEHVALRETIDSRSTASRSLGAGTRAYVAFRKRGREE